MHIIIAGKRKPTPCFRAPATGIWQTVSMLEWSEFKYADGPNLRLVASPVGIRAIEFDRGRPMPGFFSHAGDILAQDDRNPLR